LLVKLFFEAFRKLFCVLWAPRGALEYNTTPGGFCQPFFAKKDRLFLSFLLYIPAPLFWTEKGPPMQRTGSPIFARAKSPVSLYL
ncbi:MAG TPA: hypothetical protein H9996_06050, partial [Candidatus Faecalibacterium avium]|nr:hypothetical protein [Candidatus Faecalibacterium avium]